MEAAIHTSDSVRYLPRLNFDILKERVLWGAAIV